MIPLACVSPLVGMAGMAREISRSTSCRHPQALCARWADDVTPLGCRTAPSAAAQLALVIRKLPVSPVARASAPRSREIGEEFGGQAPGSDPAGYPAGLAHGPQRPRLVTIGT